MGYYLLFSVIMYIAFAVVMQREHRSLLPGGLLLFATLSLYRAAVLLASSLQRGSIGWILTMILVIPIALFVIVLPVVLAVVFVVSDIRLLRKEGRRVSNLFAMLAAAALLVAEFIFPAAYTRIPSGLPRILYGFITLIAVYFTYVLQIYTVSALLNIAHIRLDHDLDYVIVLGSGLLGGTRISPLLAGRIDKGIEVYRSNPGSRLIMSGGQGADEQLPEGRAMADYCAMKGIPSEDVLVDDRSADTNENILFSWQLILKDRNRSEQNTADQNEAKKISKAGKASDAPRVAVVSTSYHVMRALIIARVHGIPCIGFGSPTRQYFAINAFIREFIGFLNYTKRRRIITLAIISVLYFLACAFVPQVG